MVTYSGGRDCGHKGMRVAVSQWEALSRLRSGSGSLRRRGGVPGSSPSSPRRVSLEGRAEGGALGKSSGRGLEGLQVVDMSWTGATAASARLVGCPASAPLNYCPGLPDLEVFACEGGAAFPGSDLTLTPSSNLRLSLMGRRMEEVRVPHPQM
jgi:hypothetical protein